MDWHGSPSALTVDAVIAPELLHPVIVPAEALAQIPPT